jgi:DNA-binding response OmpR family regulator
MRSLFIEKQMDKQMHRVLVVDADPAAIYLLNDILKTEFNVTIITSDGEALKKIVETNYSVLIINIDLPNINYPGLLKAAKNQNSGTIVIFTGHNRQKQEELKNEVFAYLEKPLNTGQVKYVIKQILERWENQIRECLNCGAIYANYDNDENFCRYCGTPLTKLIKAPRSTATEKGSAINVKKEARKKSDKDQDNESEKRLDDSIIQKAKILVTQIDREVITDCSHFYGISPDGRKDCFTWNNSKAKVSFELYFVYFIALNIILVRKQEMEFRDILLEEIINMFRGSLTKGMYEKPSEDEIALYMLEHKIKTEDILTLEKEQKYFASQTPNNGLPIYTDLSTIAMTIYPKRLEDTYEPMIDMMQEFMTRKQTNADNHFYFMLAKYSLMGKGDLDKDGAGLLTYYTMVMTAFAKGIQLYK